MEQNAVEGATLIERGKSYVVEIPQPADKEMLNAYADILNEEYGAKFLFLTDGAKLKKKEKLTLFKNLIQELEGMICFDASVREWCNHCALITEVIQIIKEQ